MLKIKEGKKGFVDFGHLDEHGDNFLFQKKFRTNSKNHQIKIGVKIVKFLLLINRKFWANSLGLSRSAQAMTMSPRCCFKLV